jgi:hypothetical protein
VEELLSGWKMTQVFDFVEECVDCLACKIYFVAYTILVTDLVRLLSSSLSARNH